LIYLDSSCIVKLIIAEDESEALHALLVDEGTPSTFTSQLAVTEVKRALHAQGETELAASVAALPGHLQVPGQTILARPATGDMFSAAGDLLPGSALRSLDAVHLATARAAGAALTAVVTYDTRMAAAARDVGLTVLAPQRLPDAATPDEATPPRFSDGGRKTPFAVDGG